MKNSFILRAPTVSGDWYSFYINDCPVLITGNTFVLLGKPNSPIMYKDVYRGDYETGLFEGDIIYFDDSEWLVCYQRGFYAINKDYKITYLYQIGEYRKIGVCGHDMTFPIDFIRRVKHMFMVDDITFNLWNVRAMSNGNLLITNVKDAVPAEDIHQECGVLLEGVRVFLGKEYNGKTVKLHGGRVAYESNNIYYDITNGGELVGYIPPVTK